jgi:hypothetical protein
MAFFGPHNLRPVGHFQRIRHVGRSRGVYDGDIHVVMDDIKDRRQLKKLQVQAQHAVLR